MSIVSAAPRPSLGLAFPALFPRRVLNLLLRLAGAAVAFTLLLYLCGWLVRPVARPTPAPDAARMAETERARENARTINPARATVIAQQVNYDLGEAAPWWPKREAPVLAALVHEGRLPPVAGRTGSEPVVMRGVDGIGHYGGTWHRFANSINDLNTIFWRLSGSNLVRWSPQGYPLVPHVAKSWEISPDFRRYVFTLRRGMRWSDGHPVSVDDLLYWYRHELGHFDVQPRNLLRSGGTLGRVRALDESRVQFEFEHPNPLFLERLASTSMNPEDFTDHIVPSHYLRPYHPTLGDPVLIKRTMQALQLNSPVALYKHLKHHLNPEHPRLWPWVPYTWRSTPPHTFVRNPYYAVVDTEGNQLPYLDRLVMEVRGNELIGIAAANGEPSMQDRHIRYDDHTLLMDNARRHGYSVYHWKPSTQSLFTVFPNLNRRVDPARPETAWKHRLLNEARFRQALSLAIDRRKIIRAEYHDSTEPAQLAPPPDSPFAHERLRRAFTEFDPARAGGLLDELGLRGRDAEGFRTFPDGSRMAFALELSDYTGRGPADFVVEDWAAVGVRVVPRMRPRRLFEQEKLTFEHDFTVWTGESEFYPLVEPRNFVPTYSEAFYAPAYGAWYQHGGLYGDAAGSRPNAVAPPPEHPLRRAMELLDQTLVLPDERERIARFGQVQDIAAAQVWSISISSPPPQLVVVKNGFRNVPRMALFGGNFQSPANAGIETYFWAEPREEPSRFERTKRAIASLAPGQQDPGRRAAPRDPGASGPPWAGLVAGLTGVGALVLGLRHRWIGRRLLLMVPTLALVSVIVFALVQLPPGDYATIRVARLELQGSPESEALAAELRKTFRLDQPFWRQYAHWVGLEWFVGFDPAAAGLLQGQLGHSMEHEKPVADVVGDRIWLTLLVSVGAVIFTWALAVPAGIYSAVRHHSWADHVLTVLAFVALSVPSFLLALVTIYVGKRWFGTDLQGLFSPEYASMRSWSWGKFVDLCQHLWLPIVVLGCGAAAGMVRMLRANVLDELRKPYVTTARAKGMRPLAVLLRYPVRMALNPFVSGIGALFPQLISGGAVVAMVLSLPLLGPTLLDALLAEDVYLAASMLMVLSVLGMVGTLLSDLLLLWLDPRIRFADGDP